MTELDEWPEIRTLNVNTYVYTPWLKIIPWSKTVDGDYVRSWQNITDLDTVPKEYRMMALLLG